MNTDSILHLLVILLGIAGFAIAQYIFVKKTEHQKSSGSARALVCPLGHTCDPVIHSPYSFFFGIRVEVLGMAYYGSVIILHAILLAFSGLALPVLSLGMLAATAAAFLFSLYLTFVQAFLLKIWCTWCLFSASLCTLIFLLALFVR